MPKRFGYESIAEVLRGGDPRSLHGVTRAIAEIAYEPQRFPELIDAMSHDDAIVRMRAADAAEKISRDHPEYLAPHKAQLLSIAATTDQSSLRWHLAQMLPRLALEPVERRNVVKLMKRYLDDRSAIVRTCAMQTLADLAIADRSLRRSVIPAIRNAALRGTAVMRNRGAHLLQLLER